VEGALKIKDYKDKEKNRRTKVYIAGHKVICFGAKESKNKKIPEEGHEDAEGNLADDI
jgi:hypothetical protein